jgi:hypothetical protein
MIPELRAKVAQYANEISPLVDVLEIGSYDVNGGVSDLFTFHLGIDMREGPGVDAVVNGHDLIATFEPSSFDVVVWLETMEHDDQFWVTFNGIKHVLRANGHLIVSAPTFYYDRHAVPHDYWRFSEDAFTSLLKGWNIKHLETLDGNTVVCLAQKPEEAVSELAEAKRRVGELEDQLDYIVRKTKFLEDTMSISPHHIQVSGQGSKV